MKSLSEPAFQTLAGVETWIVAGIRRESHIAHAHLAQVLGWIERVKPRRAILTHLNYSMDYRTLVSELPDGVEPAYDGQTIAIDR